MSSQSCEKIKVFARVRPSKEEKVQKVVHIDNNNKITINVENDPKRFEFDGVFGEDSKQDEVFDGAASRIVHGTVQGYNGTIFAYGQTGSGKTHTMMGESANMDCGSGIIPRSLKKLFDLLDKNTKEKPAQFSFKITMAYVEIYNSHIYDLLNVSDKKHQTGLDYDGTVIVKDATRIAVKNFDDAIEKVRRGWMNRSVAETDMNRSSSRSHALLLIKICTEELHGHEQHGPISTVKSAFLNLVDLAGSERASDSKVEGERLKETAHINKSLLELANVFRLREKGDSFVCRNSHLTYILKDSLGGNCRTAMIVNLYADKNFYSESLSTLNFSANMSTIKNKVVENKKHKGGIVGTYEERIGGLEAELEKTQKELSKMKKWRSDHENYSGQLEKELEKVKYENDELKIENELYMEEIESGRKATTDAVSSQIGKSVSSMLGSLEGDKLSRKRNEMRRTMKSEGEKETELKRETAFLRQQLAEVSADLAKAQKMIVEEQEKVFQSEEENAELEVKLYMAQAKAEHLHSDVELLKSSHKDELKDMERLKNSLFDKENREMELKADMDRLKGDIRALDMKLAEKEKEKKASDEVLASSNEKLRNAEIEKNAQKRELDELRLSLENDKKEVEEERRKSWSEFHRLKAEIDKIVVDNHNEMTNKMAEKDDEIKGWIKLLKQMSEKAGELERKWNFEKGEREEAEERERELKLRIAQLERKDLDREDNPSEGNGLEERQEKRQKESSRCGNSSRIINPFSFASLSNELDNLQNVKAGKEEGRKEPMLQTMGEEKKRDEGEEASSNGDEQAPVSHKKEMVCPLCTSNKKYRSTNPVNLYTHINNAHKVTTQEALITFRCECGHEAHSGVHATNKKTNKCEIQSYEVIKREPIQSPECSLCQHRPPSLNAFISHLLGRAHKKTLADTGIKLECDCGSIIASSKDAEKHNLTKCSRSFRILSSVDEEEKKKSEGEKRHPCNINEKGRGDQ